MARSFTRVLISAARASARASRRYEANRRKEIATNERYARALEKENLRIQKESLKIAKQQYLDLRLSEAALLTIEDNDLFNYLNEGILFETLEIDDTIDFQKLKPDYIPPSIEIPEEMFVYPQEPIEETYINKAGRMPVWGYVLKSSKHSWLRKIERAKEEYVNSHSNWRKEVSQVNSSIEEYKMQLVKNKQVYDTDYKNKCIEIEEFKKSYLEGDEESISSYASIVLESSSYKIDWERDVKVGFSRDPGELIVEYRFPTIDVIPKICEYKYVKTKDIIEEKTRKKADVDSCYKNLISSIALRSIHEICESDQSNLIKVIIFNGFVKTIDKGTGREINPTLFSISVTKEVFNQISLEKVEPIKCIQNLSAKISSSPSSLIPIKPLKEFVMTDKRYVNEIDIVSSIDQRPNLMELNPFEFENFVTNLFSKMGLETKLTRSSKDGGVDAVAFDIRPVLGGKIVIQAKRYKNVVGVAAVRDLYGTMINEGATKGLLVSTSWYGPDAYEFAKDKPIELIDGSGLLYLLNGIGVEAQIIMPYER